MNQRLRLSEILTNVSSIIYQSQLNKEFGGLFQAVFVNSCTSKKKDTDEISDGKNRNLRNPINSIQSRRTFDKTKQSRMLYRMLLPFFFTTTSDSGIFGLIILTQKMRFLSIARKDRKVQPI
ncbi:hypothetical protein B9Z55_019124 [Caenorhabditis nigoni]|uniref:Uncharacterized protein n=1 Tax=Caenorhabditis nigoni TaxID=1611254 RepID=A0A2G5TH83_9PELO|nr:hypothetical protein B9Z55_019124 [Caenorhabditis nigoni]